MRVNCILIWPVYVLATNTENIKVNLVVFFLNRQRVFCNKTLPIRSILNTLQAAEAGSWAQKFKYPLLNANGSTSLSEIVDGLAERKTHKMT